MGNDREVSSTTDKYSHVAPFHKYTEVHAHEVHAHGSMHKDRKKSNAVGKYALVAPFHRYTALTFTLIAAWAMTGKSPAL